MLQTSPLRFPYDITISALGISAFACTLMVYTLTQMLGFGRRNEFAVKGRVVLITGGSDGMGRAIATELAGRGAHVVVVARTASKLQSTVEDMKRSAMDSMQQRFLYISADLSVSAECDRVIADVTNWNHGSAPDIVWCCAGFCLPGFFTEVPISVQRQQMDTVYWTAANTAHSTLRNWLAPVSPDNQKRTPRRHLIFTCSTLAFTPIAGYGPYSPAKAAIRSLSDTLSQEIEMYNGAFTQRYSKRAPATDVKIHTVFPMGILTGGFENEQRLKPALTKLLEEADKPQTPKEVAQISISALERGEYSITTTLVGHIMKGTALGSSPRNSPIRDTLLSWLSNLIFLRVIPDLRSKAFNWGRVNGLPNAEYLGAGTAKALSPSS